MASFTVTYTDNGFSDVFAEQQIVEDAGGVLNVCQCKTEADVIRYSEGANALIVQWAPITRPVIESLTDCSVIVRLGIGVDNVDIPAATEHGISVCNVPDYCINEVADHAMAMALSLGRQLTHVKQRMSDGTWSIVPPFPMPAFSDMVFGTLGYGRIAKAVLKRAKAFGFKLATHDPYSQINEDDGVMSCGLEQLLRMSDILSLHSPLTESTHHVINASTIPMMKPSAIIINTARGGLIDTAALADALTDRIIAGAGLDVFEIEPLPLDHPLRTCDNALLTSHVSWYSEASVPTLQKKAAEEAVRGCLGQSLTSQLN